MTITEFTHAATGEKCRYALHPSGLPIYVWEKPKYGSSYAVFATKYGSVDTTFTVNGRSLTVPEGIAHYLEHKLFENEDCDAFEKYAKTGASANAYTSFDRTAYLFSCTGDITPSLEILLDFVQDPYFTPESVQKEQGIIGQEIRMCEDSPSRCVLFNMLQGLYHRHPVRIDIAGTVESIDEITDTLLYDCYAAFYNLHNMVLAVAGNVTFEQVWAVADRMLKPAPAWKMNRPVADEPETAKTARVEASMPVSAPLFCLGFKETMTDEYVDASRLAAANLLMPLLAGGSSPLYADLMNKGLINESFDIEYFDGRSFALGMFSGESRDPDAVAEAIHQEIDRVRKEGFSDADFNAAKRALYGAQLRQFNQPEACGELLIADHFYGRAPFAFADAIASVTKEQVEQLLKDGFTRDKSTLSIVKA